MLEVFFSFRGRIGRLSYFLRSLVLGGVLGVMLVASVVPIVMGGYPPRPGAAMGLIVLCALLLVPALWSSFSLQARRFRDIGLDPVVVIPTWIAIQFVDALVATFTPSVSVGFAHHTVVGLLVNLAASLGLLF